jgi:N-sulfoglucosamine sulfohydrolase
LWSATIGDEDVARPNVLLLTVDDMSCDSVGAFGCELAGTTPNIDQLAAASMRFDHGFVQVSNCMPCRNVMMSGRYPQNNGVEGFRPFPEATHPVLCDMLGQAGYFTAIYGKHKHSTPYTPYAWDLHIGAGDGLPQMRNPQSYYEAAKQGIVAAAEAKQPFFLSINIIDPHRPFYRPGNKRNPAPSRVFKPNEVPIPGFLFEHKTVRAEVARYYSTVRRADDSVGAVLRALREKGVENNTVVVFLSDHGMGLPFAKTMVYYHSLHTPLIVKWPGVTRPNSVDKQHMVSAVDVAPTLLDVVGVAHPKGLDGRSFYPLLKGQEQADRDFVIGVYNENFARDRHITRTVISKKFGYIFNPWSDGKFKFRGAAQGTATYRVMRELAETDPAIAARLKLFDYRVLEEFYDYEKDPNALNNLIDDPIYQDDIQLARQRLLAWMQETGDHCLQAFRNRDNPAAIEAYMAKQRAMKSQGN